MEDRRHGAPVHPPGWSHVVYVTLGKCGTKETVVDAYSVVSTVCADSTACVRDFLAGVHAVDSTAFRSRLRDVPDLDFVGEPRLNRDHPDPHLHDNLRERRTCQVVHL